MSSGARLSQPLLRLTILAFVHWPAQAQLAPHQPKSPWKPEQLDCHQVLFQAGPGSLGRRSAMGWGDVHSSERPLLPSLDKYLLSAHFEAGTMLGARDPAAAPYPPPIVHSRSDCPWRCKWKPSHSKATSPSLPSGTRLEEGAGERQVQGVDEAGEDATN